MCGIAVAIDWEDAEATVHRLIAGVMHRGDVTDPVLSLSDKTVMGTRRLRIVDADRAVQPQPSFDHRILVSFNGEIYNHAELRRELEACGVAFRTASDTELLASSLRVWGAGALGRINGMYAFVALDVANREFLAARDPLGVKPLYLIQSGASFLFCSEIRPLLSTVEAGNVMLLPPGHFLTGTKLIRFKSFLTHQARSAAEHDPKALDRLLAAAVDMRIPPDLPFALMFSGGVDSTLIAHYARQTRPEAPGYFLGNDLAPDYQYAARYADQTGLDLRRVPLDDGNEDTVSRIRDIVATTETFEPGVVRDGLCSYLLSRRIHQDGYRVALCGEGADELFAGYVPLELAFADGDIAGAFVRDQCLGGMHRTNLQRLDRCGMRFQVEVREPFLDPAVVAYALGLSSSDLVHWVDGSARGKAPLRGIWDLHHDRLPTIIRDRLKIPLHVGSGLDVSQKDSPWIAFAEQTISDRELADGKQRFASFDIRTKEEYLYLNALAETLDVTRVPHLTARARLRFPSLSNAAINTELLRAYLVEA
jgi:asparagine synthase (glutamine-hydrolysing)